MNILKKAALCGASSSHILALSLAVTAGVGFASPALADEEVVDCYYDTNGQTFRCE
jgi:hypothetical protein